MRVVLDSNVLLSALISPHGPPHRLFEAWREGRFELVTAAEQLEEIRRASRYPKFKSVLQPHLVGAMVNNMQRAIMVERVPADFETDDPFDAFLLGIAQVGQANYLVTGDHRAGLLAKGAVGITRIVTPARFCDTVLK